MTSSSPFSKEMTPFAEQVRYRTVSPGYPGFGERMAHFCNGTVTVVGQTFNHYRGAAGTVTFINDGFHVRVFITAHATSDSTVQGVTRHVVGQRFIYCRTQTWVRRRIAAAQTRRCHQLANDFGKDLTALGILCRFAVFGVGPLTMTCHKSSPKIAPFQAALITNSSIACRLLHDLVSAAASAASTSGRSDVQ